MTNYNWKKLFTAPGGRKYFLDIVSNRVSAADQSGYFPDQTDDGVLWINPNDTIVFQYSKENCHDWGFIRVYRETEERASMGVTMGEAFLLSKHFGFKVEYHGVNGLVWDITPREVTPVVVMSVETAGSSVQEN